MKQEAMIELMTVAVAQELMEAAEGLLVEYAEGKDVLHSSPRSKIRRLSRASMFVDALPGMDGAAVGHMINELDDLGVIDRMEGCSKERVAEGLVLS